MYFLKCIVYSKQCTFYSVHGTTVHWNLYNLHCFLYTVHGTTVSVFCKGTLHKVHQFPVFCVGYTVQCTRYISFLYSIVFYVGFTVQFTGYNSFLYSVYGTLYNLHGTTVFCILCRVHCTMYIVQ